MFEFLEREGAQVLVEPIATWVAYLMYQAKAHAKRKWPVTRPHRNPEVVRGARSISPINRAAQEAGGIAVGERMWNYFYHRTIENLGGSPTI
jgi:hypothetical protein